jgi:hypothetical protein
MNTDFDYDFSNFSTSKESRKKFKCTLKYLNETYPEVFRRNKILDQEQAREILKEFYLPVLIQSGKASVYYTQGEKYTTQHVYMKHPSKKFSPLKESEEAMKIINDKDLSALEKSYSLSTMFPQFTSKQIYGYLKRNSFP